VVGAKTYKVYFGGQATHRTIVTLYAQRRNAPLMAGSGGPGMIIKPKSGHWEETGGSGGEVLIFYCEM